MCLSVLFIQKGKNKNHINKLMCVIGKWSTAQVSIWTARSFSIIRNTFEKYVSLQWYFQYVVYFQMFCLLKRLFSKFSNNLKTNAFFFNSLCLVCSQNTNDTYITVSKPLKAITQWWTLVELCHEILNITAIHVIGPAVLITSPSMYKD